MEKQLSYRGNEVNKKNNPNIVIPVLTVFLFLVLVGISLYQMFYEVKIVSDVMIAKEVRVLVDIFKRIDKKCKIIGFDYQKNPINFLNVEKFVGSEVGPMNLAYPKNWEGPYLRDNPTIQDKEYQIVKTKQGYFVTPGDGVKLSNDKVVGKDIVLDEKADIPKMMVDKKALNFKGNALAAPLSVGVSNVGKVILDNIIKSDEGLTQYDPVCKKPAGVRLAMK